MSKVRSLLDRFEKTIESNKQAAASTKGKMFLTSVASRSRPTVTSPKKLQQHNVAVQMSSPPKVPMRALSDATSSTVSLDSEELSERSIKSSSSRHSTKQQESSKTITCIRVDESNDEISIAESSAASINGGDEDNNKNCTEEIKNTAVIEEEEKTKEVAVKKKKKKTTKELTEKKTKKTIDPSKPKRKKGTSEADVEALFDEESFASGSFHSVSERMKRLPREVVFEGDDEDSDSDSDC